MAKFSLKSIALAVTLGLSGLGIANTAIASDAAHTAKQSWSFNGPFGTFDVASAQRGYQVYREVCSSCHALEHLSFRHLGDKGAPFYNAKFPNPNDNPVVKAFAKDWSVPDIDQDNGDVIDRPGIPADKFPAIYANPIAASASNGGAVPPDLSIITKARTGGADYIYALLTGYHDAPHGVDLAEGTYYNSAFSGNAIKMAPPLFDDLIEYQTPAAAKSAHGDDHGTHSTVPHASTDQMARDVVQFLTWAGDPKLEQRKRLGFATFLFLFIFAILLFMTYKEVWRNVKH